MSLRRVLCPLRFPFVSTSSSPYGAAETPLEQATEVEEDIGDDGDSDGDRWSRMLPEMLVEIVKRVEAGSERWPLRKDVVSFAAVCRRWRDAAAAVVSSPIDSGVITFTSSLKQHGPRDLPMQCLIKRNKTTSMFYLYLSITPSFMDQGKFLLAAKRFRRGSHTEYIISLDADDLSQGSNAYMGKLRSDFLGKTFKIYDSCPPFSGARASNSRSGRRFANKQISPQVPAGNFESGQASYKFNIQKSRGPRRMLCTLQCPPAHKNKQEGPLKAKDGSFAPEVFLKNKAPRWHEHLKCWCLNFHGRVTVASVKNFQLVAMQKDSYKDEDTVLQFGKVGDDTFTMDYKQPLSAFQAFAICLTSFGTKLACE